MREGLTAALGEVGLLAGLPAELRERLAAEARTVRVAAGEWLFREGDPAHSMFVTRSGRLEIVGGEPSPVVIRTLKRGSIFGELALLGDGRRSASAFARRDSELIELRREQFEWLIGTSPEFAVELTRSIGRQLAASRAPALPAPPPRTLGVVALDARAPAARLCDLLARALQRHGTVAHVHEGDAGRPADRVALLDRAARDHERVLLDGGDVPYGDPWAEFCRDESDLVIAVSGGGLDAAARARPAALHGCELLVVGGAMSGTAAESLAPREMHLLAEGAQLPGAVEALARRLTGHAIGLVMSGGGARAFAHLGVFDELCAAGVRIDRVGGTSLGAIMAGFIAAGASAEEIHAIFRRDFVAGNPTNDYTLPVFGLIRGRKARRMFAANFGDVRIEELARRFFCVSCDLVSREAVVHRTGRLRDALYASVAIPGIFPPMRDAHGRLHVDGGVVDNLPVATMAGAGEGPVIAVDVGRRDDPATVTGPRHLRPLGRAITGAEVALPRIGETLLRTLALGSSDTVAAGLLHADLVITPRVAGVGILDWKRLNDVREIGRRAGADALAGLDAQSALARALR